MLGWFRLLLFSLWRKDAQASLPRLWHSSSLGSRRRLLGRYDAAVTSDDNRRHWAAADGLSANAANSPDVRRVLRNRARYEVANNSYLARCTTVLWSQRVSRSGPRQLRRARVPCTCG